MSDKIYYFKIVKFKNWNNYCCISCCFEHSIFCNKREFWFEMGYHLSRNQNSLVLKIDHE